MTQKGILVSPDGSSLQDSRPQYDSRKQKLQINLNPDYKHIDVIPITPNAIVANAGNSYFVEETLFTLPHKLGFKPTCLVYFYVVSIAGDITQGGGYSKDAYYFESSGLDDRIFYDADETNFYIYHSLDSSFIGDWTSTASDYVMSVKYMICSNKNTSV